MNDRGPDYEGCVAKAWKANAEAVYGLLMNRDRDVLEKLLGFSERFGYPFEDVLAHAKADEMFRAWFAVDPGRQSIHQKLAADWLRELPWVDGFDVLPVVGRNAWYVTGDGDLVKGRNPHKLKSLDFRWRTGMRSVFAMHKYTKQGGGSQDNQFTDVMSTLACWSAGAADESTVLLGIVDGDYYTGKKMGELRSRCRVVRPLSFALPITQVPSCLASLDDF